MVENKAKRGGVVMTEYIECPKCEGMGEYRDETMDSGKEKLIECDLCEGQQEILKQ